MHKILSAIAGLVVAVGLVAVPSTAHAATENGPERQTFPGAVLYGLAHPDAAPAGSNDWNCQPSAAHPRPVVLVHGTFANQFNSYAFLSPKLKQQGYCVFSLNYGATDTPASLAPGVFGLGPTMESAAELAAFVERVRTATGSSKVDLVGYSQGAIVARGYLKFFGGADAANPANNKVRRVVSYAGTNHGTTLSGLATLASTLNLLGITGQLVGPSLAEQTIGSAYLTALNSGGDTMPGIDYTILTTKYDKISTPYRNSFLTAGPGATVKNIVVQDGCLIDFSSHLSLPYSLRASDYTLKALDPGTWRRIRCSLETPAV